MDAAVRDGELPLVTACAESGCRREATWSDDDQAFLCDLHYLARFEADFVAVLERVMQEIGGLR